MTRKIRGAATTLLEVIAELDDENGPGLEEQVLNLPAQGETLTPTRLRARKLTWPIDSLHEMTGYSFSDGIRIRLVRRDEVKKKRHAP
jgi:hypothetical protein